MNIPQTLYKYIDRALLPIIKTSVPNEIVGYRLEKEREFWEDSEIDYYLKILNNVHARISSALSHLSLMVAICLFLIGIASKDERVELVGYIILVDASIYIFLVLLSIRGLKTIGLNHDYESIEKYTDHLRNEMIIKYSIIQLVNSLTLIATISLGLAVGFGWPISLALA